MKTSTISPNKQKTAKPSRARKWGRGLAVLLFWLAVWQLCFWRVNNGLLVPAPQVVAQRFGQLLLDGNFWRATAASLLRILEGFGLGLAAGVLLALLTRLSRIADALISPVVKAIRATPVVSFIILVIIWTSRDFVPVFIVILMVAPVFWGNVRTGIDYTDGQLLEMAQVFRLGRAKTVRRIYVPSIMPHFLSACTASLGLAWKSGITAEVLSAPRYSIGGELNNGRVYLETADVFVWTVVVIILSLCIEALLLRLAKRIGRQYNVN